MPLSGTEQHPGTSRERSATAVFAALCATPPVSRTELALKTGLSKPTVGTSLQLLIEAGLIRERGHLTGRRGPRALLFEPCRDEPVVLALDIGTHRVRGVLADIHGRACGGSEVELAKSDADHVLVAVSELRDRLVDRDLEAAIVGSPGVVDPSSGRVRICDQIEGWKDVKAQAVLTELLGIDVAVENATNLAALGELEDGAGRGSDSLAYLSIDAALGAALILNGSLHRGRHGAAGEVGFLPSGDLNGEAPPHAAAKAVHLPNHGPMVRALTETGILEIAQSLQPSFRGDVAELLAQAHDGDQLGQAVSTLLALPLAVTIAGIAAVVDVELVLVGGGVGSGARHLLEPASQHLARLVPYVPRLELAELGVRATLRGAGARGAEIARRRMIRRALANAA